MYPVCYKMKKDECKWRSVHGSLVKVVRISTHEDTVREVAYITNTQKKTLANQGHFQNLFL
jgi:hypothetical protein